MESIEILEKLDVIISLLIPPYKQEKYTIGHDVLPYCDGQHTADDIARKTKKSRASVHKAIQRLRKSFIIKNITKDSQTYYIRLL
jgi:hypothetical protein